MTSKVIDGLDLNGQRATNAADPTGAADLATKAYVDTVAAGFTLKAPAVAAATTNITVSNPGTSTFDTITLSPGDRLALMNQTAGAENGLYQFNGASSALTRTSDANTGALLEGALFTVDKGVTYGDQMYYVTTDAIVIGTTVIVFARFAPGQTYTGTNGVNVSGSSITGVVAASGGLSVGASGFQVDRTKTPQLYATSIGNGSLTSIDVVHNLGTKDIIYKMYDNGTDDEVIIKGHRTDTNTLSFVFPSAPTSNQYRVIVHG